MNEISKELSKDPETAKYYKLNEDNINKIKNLKDENASSYTDDFSLLSMETMMGVKRKKNKNEKREKEKKKKRRGRREK